MGKEVQKLEGLSVKYKMWISAENGEDIMGNGKWLLLKTIDEEGSLKAAADKLCMSYRKAWGSLKNTEEYLGFPIVEKHRGGSQGGRTSLTKDGKKLIETYEVFYHEAKASIKDAFVKFMEDLKK